MRKRIAMLRSPELASLLDGSSAGELIHEELARYGLQQLIELEASTRSSVPTAMSALRSGSATATATGPAA